MTLEELLNINDNNKLEEFIKNQNLENINYWEILIYMKDQIDISSELDFFSVEETGDELVYYKEKQKYLALFSIGQILDELFETLQLDKFENNTQKAQRLIEYAINDA